MSPSEVIKGLDVGRAVTNTLAAAALAGTGWAVSTTIDLQRVQATLIQSREAHSLAISEAREERHALEQAVLGLLEFRSETVGNRYTSADALLHVTSNGQEFRMIWQELESKADADDVPPPEVLRRLEAIEADIEQMRRD